MSRKEPLCPLRRKSMARLIIRDTFGASDSLVVSGVFFWTYLLATCTDDTLLCLWESVEKRQLEQPAATDAAPAEVAA